MPIVTPDIYIQFINYHCNYVYIFVPVFTLHPSCRNGDARIVRCHRSSTLSCSYPKRFTISLHTVDHHAHRRRHTHHTYDTIGAQTLNTRSHNISSRVRARNLHPVMSAFITFIPLPSWHNLHSTALMRMQPLTCQP
jgi:hypothetical protein